MWTDPWIPDHPPRPPRPQFEGYWLGTHLPDNNNPTPIPGNPQLKHKIWKTTLPVKIKYFLWRILSKGLATGSNLKRRHVIHDDQCRRCCQTEETEFGELQDL
ncbi:hypothetical protein Bca52824_038871 [Brassica carinata]|uniref:Reverse transcriptase zinc-binding domain-containing protein n=1 Tax=Brassica carinata TaxID=52824 RepID=A0A8X7UVB5_BRACI|nr:hypothetical protein Bca52824_038871 [Brassica carinata]